MNGKKLSKLSFAVIFSFLILITPIFHANAQDYKIKITDAGYDDLDKDGKSDDVYIYFNLVNKEQDDDNDDEDDENEFVLIFVLELPSGYRFFHYWNLELNSVHRTLQFTIHAINTATESGWYTANIYLFEDGYDLIAWDSIVFDPPLGGVGSPPAYILM